MTSDTASLRTRRNEAGQPDPEALAPGRGLGGEVPVGLDLVLDRVLLDAPRVALDPLGARGVVADRLLEIGGVLGHGSLAGPAECGAQGLPMPNHDELAAKPQSGSPALLTLLQRVAYPELGGAALGLRRSRLKTYLRCRSFSSSVPFQKSISSSSRRLRSPVYCEMSSMYAV